MPSFIPASEKTGYSQPFFDLHDTFSRPITMYKSSEQIVTIINNDNNVFFPDAPFNDVTQTVIQSGVFSARIKYITKEDLKFFSTAQDQITIKLEEGMVRLKLDVSGSSYLTDAKRVIFDETIFEPVTSKRPHGMFVPDFYTFYLKKIN